MPNLIDPALCTGCTACVSACPKGCLTMTPDENGFCYPAMINDADCINCRLCERACPLLQKPVSLPEPIAFAAYSVDPQTREDSSSGGVFSELARVVLARGGAVFGAAYDENFRVVHICAENEASLSALRGAKYAQSDLTGIFQQVKTRLSGQQPVLFSGTPCQVGGLKRFLGHDDPNLICVDFVCHGVPSPMAWERYVTLMGADGPIRSINLRCKETGWSRYRYCNLFTYEDGNRISIPSGENLYMKLFVNDYINRSSCQSCRFKGTSRVSDLTLGDFWGVWDVLPEMDDDRGTSVVLVHSEKGRQLWDTLSSRLIQRQVSLTDAVRQNPSALVSSNAKPLRDTMLNHIRSGQIETCAELLPRKKSGLLQKIRRKAVKTLRLFVKKR